MIDVLIADDQEMVRTGIRMILEAEEDIRVVGEAADGHEAVERARLLRPDIVLMDIQMPVLDGIEATRRLSEEDRSGHPQSALSLGGILTHTFPDQTSDGGASAKRDEDAPRSRTIDTARYEEYVQRDGEQADGETRQQRVHRVELIQRGSQRLHRRSL